MTLNEIKTLLSNFPRVELGLNPTPLHRMFNLEQKLGHAPLYVKRDDLNGLGVGGNKVRNLEFLLGEAISQGADTVVVSGMLQSNFCSLAAAACRRAKLHCVIVHNEDVPAKLEGNMILNRLLGAEQRFIGSVDSSVREPYAAKLCGELGREGRKAYLIPNGASTAVGCLGYVQMAAELLEQVQADPALADLKSICVPGGNGGLAAGTIFGTALLEHPFHVELISVECTEEELRGIQQQFWADLKVLTAVSPNLTLDEVTTFHNDYRCGGWGLIDDEVVDFLYDFAQTEGFFVEKVYTGKTLYGMVKLAEQGYFKQGACFLHSGGIGALFSQFE